MADKEEHRLTLELAELQQAIPEAPVQEEGLTALKSQLEAACQQLSKMEGTQPEAIADAKARSQELLQRFEESLAQHAAKENSEKLVRRRHSDKGPPVPGVETSALGILVPTRHVGKQPLQQKKQQTLTNYFTLEKMKKDLQRPRSQGPAERYSPYPESSPPSAARRASSARPQVTFAEVAKCSAG